MGTLFILHFTRREATHLSTKRKHAIAPIWQDLKLEEMSRLKALEVLGISSEMLEDDKAKILGSLGVPTWGNSGISTVIDRDRNAGGTWNLFSKRRHTASAAPGMPAPICGMIAPAPTQVTSWLRKFTSQRAGTVIRTEHEGTTALW